ncbi:hypothetical protein [Collinsella intestinalis]|uniref:hypothetical protein n=1 Tax=Collinsella intestinalis TaxID=147207 RepID=UPI0022DFA7A9|nr:hypothetical protein [Collinsella intestinalis]
MFEFLTRRHAAQAEIPLSEVRFTREDLFVLLGGCDTGMLANGEFTIDFDQLERRGTDPWRRDMAERLSPTGLVDAEGVPSDELEIAIRPLNKPGEVLDDGSTPQAAGERETRTVSAVFYEGDGTAIKRMPGRRAGFNIVPLGPEAEWDAAFRLLSGIGALCHVGKSERIVSDVEPRIGESIVRNDADWLMSFCADHGSDGSALVDFAARLSSDRALRSSKRYIVSADYRGCTFDRSLGFSIPQGNSESFKTKCAYAFPSAGVFLTSAGAFARRGDESLMEFSVIDFVSEGTLLDYMLDFYEYPEELRRW